MNDYLIYLLKSATSISVFYLFYLIFLRRDTLFKVNRLFLLGTILFSLIVPLFNIHLGSTSLSSAYVISLDEVTVSLTGISGNTGNFNLAFLLLVTYLAGVFILVTRFFINLLRINLLIRSNKKIHVKGMTVVVMEDNYYTFSFLNMIFLNRKVFEGADIRPILDHEGAHVRQLHTMDLLVAEFFAILQWFNPVAWSIRKLIHENHEYLADREVLDKGHNLISYQLRIVQDLFDARNISISHTFNRSITSKRLIMMKKSKSQGWAKYKIFAVIPAAVILFFVLACSQNEPKVSPADELLGEEIAESPVYLEPDVMAEFPGGDMALRKFISENLKYPEEAAQSGVQGKVYIQFVVDEEGKVQTFVNDKGTELPPPPPPPAKEQVTSDGEVSPPPPPATTNAKGIVVVDFRTNDNSENKFDPELVKLLEEEAIRVIKTLPQFKPAMKDGKPVKVMYTMPINFKLQ